MTQNEFIEFYLTPEEKDAYFKKIPMTKKIFFSMMDTLFILPFSKENEEILHSIMTKFIDFIPEYCEHITGMRVTGI